MTYCSENETTYAPRLRTVHIPKSKALRKSGSKNVTNLLWEGLSEATQRQVVAHEDRAEERSRNHEREGRDGFVYLVEAVGCGRFKIGESYNPMGRIPGLTTGCPFPLRIVALKFSADRKRLEKLWHKKFSDRRVHGEWFELSQPDVESFLSFSEEVA